MAVVLQKRIYYTTNSSWVWGRWVLLGVLIIALLAAVFLLNFHRRKHGNKPLMGTSWLAPPPSYFNTQQNRYNDPAVNDQPLPLYTKDVNQNDLGYYDNEGKFIPTSPQNDYYNGFPVANGNNNVTPPPPPPQGYAGTYLQNGQNAQSSTTVYDEDIDVRRPEQMATTVDSVQPIYHPPPGPPPSSVTARNTSTNA